MSAEKEPPNISDGPQAMSDYATWLASSVAGYEALGKSLIKHKAEKGRVVESVVKGALRSILPGRFSIGTGFVITSSGNISSQLDLIIYDHLSNSPIILEGGTGLFPIECVYGFVEVKSVLNRQAIDGVMKAVKTVRELANEKRFIHYGEHKDESGKQIVGEFEFSDRLPPRSFAFAINSVYSDIQTAEAQLKESSELAPAHLHGLVVLERDWFIRQKAYKNPHEFFCRRPSTCCVLRSGAHQHPKHPNFSRSDEALLGNFELRMIFPQLTV